MTLLTKRLFIINVLLGLVQYCYSDQVVITSETGIFVNSKIIFKIKYITDVDKPLNVGDSISVQLPPFWQKPQISANSNSSFFPPISVSFSDPSIAYSLSLSEKSIDDFFSVTEITVLNILITDKQNISGNDTITIQFGNQPVKNDGIRVSKFAGEQRIYFKRFYQNQSDESLSENKYCQIDVSPQKAIRINAFVNSIVRIDDSITVKVVFLDEFGNRDNASNGVVRFYSSDQSMIGESIAENGFLSCRLPQSKSMTDSIKVVTETGMVTWSNPYVISKIDENFIWWGDLHTHAIYSGHGRGYINDLIDYAKRGSLLNFVAYTEHDWIFQSVQSLVTMAINVSNMPHEFVTLNGLEWTSRMSNTAPGHGHLTVISRNSDPVVRMNSVGTDRPTGLYDIARNKKYVLSINHPIGPYSFDWDYFNQTSISNVEMVSDGFLGILSNEYSVLNYVGIPVSTAIKNKFKVGFVGASDNHYSQPGLKNATTVRSSGLTAIISKALTRESLVDALAARHNYATTGARIILDFRIENFMMGDIIPLNYFTDDKKAFRIKAIGTSKLKYVDVIKNGELFKRFNIFTQNVFETSFLHEGIEEECSYYVKVIQEDGEVAWSSPIWFSVDTLVGLENKTSNIDAYGIKIIPSSGAGVEFIYNSPQIGVLSLNIFDILGRKVRSFGKIDTFNGYNSIYWNARDDSGSLVTSGIYYARFEGVFGVKTIRTIIIK